MLKVSEAALHRSIVEWLALALPTGSVFHHSPNEGKHLVQYRVQQKYLGVRPGWPDLEIFCHPAGWLGDDWRPVFLEIKTRSGRLTPTQREVMAALRDVGCHAEIVRSLDDTHAALSPIMELRCGVR
jgi:hypothetical protein